MSDNLPISIVEPEQTEKRELAALRLSRGGQKAAHIPHPITVPELKQQIRALREDSRAGTDSLVSTFEATLKHRYPGVKVYSAFDANAAVDYVSMNIGDTDTISTNNSAAIQELKPGLIRSGFSVINSYRNEYKIEEKKLLDYWDLPRLLDKNLESSFGVAIESEGLPRTETLKYTALLGVNAVSAEDGSVVFLEHFSNINKDLQRAERVMLVVGLDKIVGSREQAVFQSQCMGVFGMENILLGIEPKREGAASIDDLHLPPGIADREMHVIILDNGRRKLLGSKFADLFLCIGCRACNKHCPIRHAFIDAENIWTPKIYLTQYLNGSLDSIDVCLHCEGCRMECPVDIDLPYFMWQAKFEHVAQYGTSFSHKVLGRPEILAKLGTGLAPLSNWAMRQKLLRVPMESITGIDRRTRLPEFHRNTFRKKVKNHA